MMNKLADHILCNCWTRHTHQCYFEGIHKVSLGIMVVITSNIWFYCCACWKQSDIEETGLFYRWNFFRVLFNFWFFYFCWNKISLLQWNNFSWNGKLTKMYGENPWQFILGVVYIILSCLVLNMKAESHQVAYFVCDVWT